MAPSLRASTHVTLQMRLQQRLLIGGIGALTPVLVSLAVVDLRSTLAAADMITFAGYAVRVLALFTLGAISAWLHSQETSAVKLFQLGMVGPALMTTMLNGKQIQAATSAATSDRPAAVSLLFAAPLHAQEPHDRTDAQRIHSLDDAPPPGSGWNKFMRGLVGARPSSGPYFVVLAGEAFADSTHAQRRLQVVRRLDDDFDKAAIFRHPQRGGGYIIVLGGWLKPDDAKELVGEATEERLQTVVVTSLTAASSLAATARR